jgi:ESX-1-secreted protein regulator
MFIPKKPTRGYFADKLNPLFDNVLTPDGKPYTSAEVVAELQAQGLRVTESHLLQLRSGRRMHPSKATMTALAKFFDVDIRYFTDDSYHDRLNRELTVLASLREESVRRIASPMVGPTRESVHDLLCAAEDLLRREGVDRKQPNPAPMLAPSTSAIAQRDPKLTASQQSHRNRKVPPSIPFNVPHYTTGDHMFTPMTDDEKYFAELADRRPSYGRDEYWWAVVYGAGAATLAMKLAGFLRRRRAR